jgi:hypothetical protein
MLSSGAVQPAPAPVVQADASATAAFTGDLVLGNRGRRAAGGRWSRACSILALC